MEKVFVSWSGGKDCCLALYRAINSGLDVRRLFNMVSEDGLVSRSHGLAARWLQMQSQALGIPLLQQTTTDPAYEARFKEALLALKQEGITSGVFGDIDFNPHREWIERVCSDAGIKPHLPLWLQDQGSLVREFIAAGFRAVVIATRADLLGEEWLGRYVDNGFLADLAKLPGVTPCGEAGEYHTLVVDGPLFRKRLEIAKSHRVRREKGWFLEISECRLEDKA